MILTKNIIDEIVSYIDFADIQEFVKNYPELVRLEEITKKKIFTYYLIICNISEIKNIDLYNLKWKKKETQMKIFSKIQKNF